MGLVGPIPHWNEFSHFLPCCYWSTLIGLKVYIRRTIPKAENLNKLMTHIQLYKSVKYTTWTYLTMLDDIGLFECSLDETWKHVGWNWTIWTLFGWNMKACWMELDYLNTLWMKHESLLDGVELCEHSLDKTWKYVGWSWTIWTFFGWNMKTCWTW